MYERKCCVIPWPLTVRGGGPRASNPVAIARPSKAAAAAGTDAAFAPPVAADVRLRSRWPQRARAPHPVASAGNAAAASPQPLSSPAVHPGPRRPPPPPAATSAETDPPLPLPGRGRKDVANAGGVCRVRANQAFGRGGALSCPACCVKGRCEKQVRRRRRENNKQHDPVAGCTFGHDENERRNYFCRLIWPRQACFGQNRLRQPTSLRTIAESGHAAGRIQPGS